MTNALLDSLEFRAALAEFDARNREMMLTVAGAMNQLGRAIVEIAQPAVTALIEWMRAIDWESKLPPDQREAAFRRYAARYSAMHPPRALSWRRLNRDQRQLAAFDWIADHGHEPQPPAYASEKLARWNVALTDAEVDWLWDNPPTLESLSIPEATP